MTEDKTLRERILVFAIEKFMRLGFGKVTIDEISSELGMSKKTIYKFFPSKEDLLRAGIRFLTQRMARRIDEIIASHNPVSEKIADIMVVVGQQVGKVCASGANIQKLAPDVWREIETFRREQILTKIGKLIEEGRHTGVIRPELNGEVLMLMVISSVQAIITPEVLSQSSFSAQEAFLTVMKTIFEGALTEDGRRNFHVFDSSIPISQ